jgi:hypothetical protein
MGYILFDDELVRNQLKPFTFTRPVADIRCGILTIRDKWAFRLKTKITCLSKRYLEEIPEETSVNTYINGAVCPDKYLITEIDKLLVSECLVNDNNNVLAIKTTEKLSFPINFHSFTQKKFYGDVSIITQLPHIFLKNGDQIRADFRLITERRKSQAITDPFTRVYGAENIFVEEGASIKSVILNAEQGPIYIGKNAIIQEGSIVIGPVSIGEGSVVVWGSKIRPNTTIGRYSKVGGEVGSSVIFGYSNKAHDGFLGASVIGEWCNLGANCNNSNLKNDYSEVKLYNYATDKLEKTGELFCGLFMGDYTKAGISTMFNTGTVVGVCSNVFGAGFQEKHIPSFMWGGADTEYVDYRFGKALEVIRATMARRDMPLTEKDVAILQHLHDFKK